MYIYIYIYIYVCVYVYMYIITVTLEQLENSSRIFGYVPMVFFENIESSVNTVKRTHFFRFLEFQKLRFSTFHTGFSYVFDCLVSFEFLTTKNPKNTKMLLRAVSVRFLCFLCFFLVRFCWSDFCPFIKKHGFSMNVVRLGLLGTIFEGKTRVFSICCQVGTSWNHFSSYS